jgi:phage replication-related protein YjqB (UPF0714/DUF867 family)
MAADKYLNFEQLKAGETVANWRHEALPRGTTVAVIAPHGGGIEQGTSEIARAIAGHDLSVYVFEGLKAGGNGELHITSVNFDEPDGIELVSSSQRVVAIHGEGSNDIAVAYLGGRDEALGAAIRDQLTAAGFKVGKHDLPHLQGTHPDNICNRGQSGRGVQLELSRALRKRFFASLDPDGRQKPTRELDRFVQAVRRAIATIAP